jgi:AcrR family transcriptional regulator
MARPKDPNARSALVAAARQEFVRAGIQKARIEDITHACGLSKGAFYLHFESKEALFRELVQQLEASVEETRVRRETRYRALLEKGQPRRNRERFAAQLVEADAQEDRLLLELFWDWRDVIDVLLRGTQGTEFEGVIWAVLDREAARVATECRDLKAWGLLRDEVADEVVGMMIVGTYLLVARRLASFEKKPDFEPWVRSLQLLIAEGTAPPQLRRPPPPPRRKSLRRSLS